MRRRAFVAALGGAAADDARQCYARKRRLHGANAWSTCLLIGEAPGTCGRRLGRLCDCEGDEELEAYVYGDRSLEH